MAVKTVPMTYFSDILCLWAYIAQLRLDEVDARFGDQIHVEPKFCSVFGDTAGKMAATWRDKGGYEGFNAHLREAAGRFPEVSLHPDIWLTVRPASSHGPHLFLRALRLAETGGRCGEGIADRTTWAMRRAFFEQARDIGQWEVQCEVGREAGADPDLVESLIHDGTGFAALAADYKDAESLGIQGSPSFVLNEGRQKLYGNVGFRIIEANIQELLRRPGVDQASWC
jgi:predicted DsbA family dithiol-disulfide isomerase